MIEHLEFSEQIPVGIHRTLVGSELVHDNVKIQIGSLYFNLDLLNNYEENLLKVSKDKEKKLKNYEKLRTVGKGAFGAAILYRKKDDGLMVIIKEINMLDLSATERQMALNEVSRMTPLIVLHIANIENLLICLPGESSGHSGSSKHRHVL